MLRSMFANILAVSCVITSNFQHPDSWWDSDSWSRQLWGGLAWWGLLIKWCKASGGDNDVVVVYVVLRGTAGRPATPLPHLSTLCWLGHHHQSRGKLFVNDGKKWVCFLKVTTARSSNGDEVKRRFLVIWQYLPNLTVGLRWLPY